MRTPILFIHGAATGPTVWTGVVSALFGLFNAQGLPTPELRAPKRPQHGDWDEEIDALSSAASGAFIVGVSGGATLGWELLSSRYRSNAPAIPVGGILHEPAAGSLAPGLLSHVAQALSAQGLAGFGKALYSESWTPALASIDDAGVALEFAMFSRFEPTALRVPDAVLLTTGTDSPTLRHSSVTRLSETYGVPRSMIPGKHAVHLDHAQDFARAVFEQYLAVTGSQVPPRA
ncbi:alpha/beta fold hydrolase [Populibacterium corticicola]|uniref:Alpha/beta fold hydrolase n=1 Tax=Populibacterium corticicola TaxID=1812826 RepID=A0ABW5XH20_9MICO